MVEDNELVPEPSRTAYLKHPVDPSTSVCTPKINHDASVVCCSNRLCELVSVGIARNGALQRRCAAFILHDVDPIAAVSHVNDLHHRPTKHSTGAT